MKTILAALLICFLSFNSYAEDYSSYNWTKLSIPYTNTYVDWTRSRGDKEHGFSVPILQSYNEITSAQMWGLSNISVVSIRCLKGSMQFLNDTWTENRMGRGRVIKNFGSSPVIYPQTKGYEDSWQRNLFNILCR